MMANTSVVYNKAYNFEKTLRKQSCLSNINYVISNK